MSWERSKAAYLLALGVTSAACAAGSTAAPPSLGNEAGASTDTIVSASAMRLLLTHSPEALPAPPKDASNRYADDPKAAALGHRFFFDTAFSGALLDEDNNGDSHALGKVGQASKVACAGCHIPEATFLDNRSTRGQVSLAAGWGVRRTRHLLDIGQAAKSIIMWDGLHDALYNQPFQPIENAPEMNSSRLFVAEQIFKKYRASYEEVFGVIPIPLDDATRFPVLTPETTGCRKLLPGGIGKDCHGMPGDKAEYDGLSPSNQDAVTRVVVNFGKALGAYERLLTCGPGKFDKWVHGQSDALTPSEQRGAALFVGQRSSGATGGTNCNSCHTGPFFTDQAFHNVGLRPTGVGPAGSFLDTDDHGAQAGLANCSPIR